MSNALLPDIIVEAGFIPTSPGLAGTELILGDPVLGKLGTGTLAAGTVWTDISGYMPDGTPIVQDIQITRGSSRQQGPLVTYEAATCTVTLTNSDGRFSPENVTTGLYVSAGVSQVRPMVPFRIRATWHNTAYSLFSGFVKSWTPPTATAGQGYDYTVVEATDAFYVLQGNSLAELGSPVGAGELSGARVNRILAAAGWYTAPQGGTDIDAGQSALQATSYGDTVLGLLQLVADSEIGDLYIDGQGRVVFRDRHAPLADSRSNTVQAVFSDSGSPAAGSTYDQLIAAASPLAWWQLDDPAGSGTAADSSGNGHPATVTGVAFGNTSQAVAGNNSASLLASNTPQILSSYNPAFASGITAECWVNLNFQSQGGNNPRLVTSSHTDSDNNGFQLMVTGAGQPQFWVGNGTSSGNASGGSVPSSGWTHVAGTYDGSNVRLYVNGQLAAGPSAFTGTIAAGSASGISLGYAAAYNGDYLSGLLSECSVFSGAATAAQVLARYQAAPVRAGLPYAEVARPDDDTMLANDIQATCQGPSFTGTLQEVKDAASITRFLFPRTYSRSDLLLQTDTDALNWAGYVLAIARSDESRFDSMIVFASGDPDDLFPQVLGREIGDRIQVWRHPPDGSVITKDCFIRSITHTVTVDGWTTEWGLQNAARYSFLTLGSPTLGVLGSNVLAF